MCAPHLREGRMRLLIEALNQSILLCSHLAELVTEAFIMGKFDPSDLRQNGECLDL